MSTLHEYASVEWMDSEQSGASSIELREPDVDYAYASARLLSFYPVVNLRGATYEREDFSAELLDTLLGVQVNLEHDKSKVVGSIYTYKANNDGIEVGIRIDREQAKLQNLDLKDMRSGSYFSKCSVELTKDAEHSVFYGYDGGFNVQKSIPVLTGREMGIRRTTVRDPYSLQGLKVAERIKPARFTGVGLVPVPADKTSHLYSVTASDGDDEERRKTLLETETASAIAERVNISMSALDLEKLTGKVAELEAAVATLTTERETASAEVVSAKAQAAEFATKITALETELASANATVAELKAEKEVASANAKVTSILDRLQAIHPIAADALEAMREKAAAVCNDDGVIESLMVSQKNLALQAELDALKAGGPHPMVVAAEAEAAKVAQAAADAAAQAVVDAEAAKVAQEAADKAAAEAAAAAAKEKASAFDPEEDARQKLIPTFEPVTIKGQKVVPGTFI